MRHVLKNHREMRRDASCIIINVAVRRKGGEASQKASPPARHVAALPRARFVSNGAGEIDFLRRPRFRPPITCKDLDFPGGYVE